MTKESSSQKDMIILLEDQLEKARAKVPLAEMAVKYKRQVGTLVWGKIPFLPLGVCFFLTSLLLPLLPSPSLLKV